MCWNNLEHFLSISHSIVSHATAKVNIHRNTFFVAEIVATASALLSTWEAWTYQRESSKVPQTSLSNWSISSARRGWESWDYLESRSGFINAYKYLNGGGKEDRPRPFSVMPSDRIRGNEHTLEHGTFPLNIRKHFFTVRVIKHGAGYPERLWSFHPWRYSKAFWTWFWAACLRRRVVPVELQRSL